MPDPLPGSAADAPDQPSGWAAVIVNYNSGTYLRSCVASLLAQTLAPEAIIVVDNASTDDSLATIADTPARVVHAPGNVGYARGANLGISVSRSTYVAVLNPDVMLAPEAGEHLCGVLGAQERVAVVGPRIADSDGADYPSAREIPGIATSIGHFVFGSVRPDNRWSRRYRQEHLDPSSPRASDWLSGACMMLRRTALDEVGGWDERFFMFLEEVDLCVRFREAGWGVRYEPSARVEHIEGVSRRSHPYRSIADHHRSALRFAAKHWVGARRLALPFVAMALVVRAVGLMGVAATRAHLQH